MLYHFSIQVPIPVPIFCCNGMVLIILSHANDMSTLAIYVMKFHYLLCNRKLSLWMTHTISLGLQTSVQDKQCLTIHMYFSLERVCTAKKELNGIFQSPGTYIMYERFKTLDAPFIFPVKLHPISHNMSTNFLIILYSRLYSPLSDIGTDLKNIIH